MAPPSYGSYSGVGVVTAALALGSSFGIKIHGFAPRELAIGAEGEHEEWTRKARNKLDSNFDGLRYYPL